MTNPDDLRPRTQRELMLMRHAYELGLIEQRAALHMSDVRMPRTVYPDIPESPPEAPPDWQRLVAVVTSIVALVPTSGRLRELHGEFHKTYQEIMLSVLRERAERDASKAKRTAQAQTVDSVSEQEARRRERAAYVNGMIRGSEKEFTYTSEIEKAAVQAYPPLTTTRPRILPDPHDYGKTAWRWFGNSAQWQQAGTDWNDGLPAIYAITPSRMDLWQNLRASPTEEVEGDDEHG